MKDRSLGRQQFAVINQMKNTFYSLLFFLSFSFCFAQEIGISKIKVKKTSSDSLRVWIPPMQINDSVIKYSQLINRTTLVVLCQPCFSNVSSSIISFEIKINNGSKQYIRGNQFNFKKHDQLKRGGKIFISNCLINYNDLSKGSIPIILPDKKIIVVP